MSYTPTEWKAGDTVTSAKLNKMEQGISASFSNVIFETVFVADPNSIYNRYYETIDDVDDIVTAYKNGKNVLFHLPREEGYTGADIWLSMIGYIDALDDDLFPKDPGICIMNHQSCIPLSNNTTYFPDFSDVSIVNGKIQIKLYID